MYMIDIGVVHLLYKEKLSSPMSTNKWKDQNDDYYNNDEKKDLTSDDGTNEEVPR